MNRNHYWEIPVKIQRLCYQSGRNCSTGTKIVHLSSCCSIMKRDNKKQKYMVKKLVLKSCFPLKETHLFFVYDLIGFSRVCDLC